MRAAYCLLFLFAGCASTRATTAEPTRPTRPIEIAVAPPHHATLPRDAGRFSPGFAGVLGDGSMPGAALTDVDTCAPCHRDAVAQWKTSAHSFASFNNPIYRVSVEHVRSEAGRPASRHCGSCHDVGLLFDGRMDEEVVAEDVRAHFGVNCRTCHGVAEVTPDGNGSWSLADEPIPIPVRGDRESLDRHLASVVKPPLATANLCGTCHRTFLSEATGNGFHLPGADDFGPWQRSTFAGSDAARIDDPAIAEARCQDCHMPREEATLGDVAADDDGAIASHRFIGGHSWLAAMRHDDETLRRVQAFLVGAASVDIGAVMRRDGTLQIPADGAALAAGETVDLAIVVRNQRVGHRFPGGTPDSQDTWIEIAIEDAQGRRVAQAGADEERTGVDPSAHRFRALLADEHGHAVLERQANRFRAVVFNHTITPRDAVAVQYTLAVPADLPADAFPLRVVARLLHRSRNLELQVAACNEHRSARGRAFDAATRRYREALDPCVAMPVTEIARTEARLGGGSPVLDASRPTWLRAYELGLGLSHGLQEHVGRAIPALELALGGATDARSRAMILTTLADVAGREGRTDDALSYADRAEELIGAHPAIARARGDALAPVWRWAAAGAAYTRAAELAPIDDTRWAALAVAAGSAGDHATSLEAAQRGLALAPRDPDCLRAQALALDALGAEDALTSAAMDAYFAHRVRDDAPGVRARCSAGVPGCALERVPVHAHALEWITR